MKEAVYWILEVAIKNGRLDEFRTLKDEMVEATEANEPGTLNYEWSLSEDHTTCHIFERYRNSAAVMTHLTSFGEKFAGRFMTAVEPSRFVIYGNPNEAVKTALSGFGALFLAPMGGFAR